MSLKEQISANLKTAMKASDANTVGVLRLLLTALHNKEIDKKGKSGSDILTEEEALQVLMSEAKKRRESILIFEQGGRADLAAKEKSELEVIQKYLPAQMSKEEIEKAVAEIIAKNPGKNFGEVMKEVMKELKGKADAGTVSTAVKAKLG